MTLLVDDQVATFGRLAVARRALAADLKRDPATLAHGLDSGYRMRPHLRVIGEAMAEVLAGFHDRLMILTPPQVGKSSLVAEWGPFWWFTNRPQDDIIIASYGLDLALDRSKGVRQHLADYGAEFGLRTRPGSEAAHDWELTSGGHLRAAGTQGGISGFSANLVVVDDPHADRAQAESPRIRRAVHDWWSSTASKRLQPDVGVCICIMTRWHPDDFAGRRLEEEGRIEEGGRWKVVHLPAIADPKFGKDPLGRSPGEPLTHPKIPTRDKARLSAWWADMKKTSIVRDWHSLAQGDPQPTEGALVSDDLLRLIRDTTTPVEPQKIAVAVDPSGGGRDTAGIVGGFLGDDGRLWITHDRSGVMASADWSREACLLAHEINAAVLIYEKNYGGDMVLLVIRSAWDALVKEGRIPAHVLPPQMKDVHAKQGKLLRAEPIAQQMILDRVRLRGLFVDLEREWCIAGGTPVVTRRGTVPIESVQPGDEVMTRCGWRTVEWAGCTGARPTVEIRTAGGRVLRCTSNHEVWVDGRGWVAALEVEPQDRILTCPLLHPSRAFNSAASGTASPATGSTRRTRPSKESRPRPPSTEQYGPQLMAPYRSAGTSRLSTATVATSNWPTCSARLDPGNLVAPGRPAGLTSHSRGTGTTSAPTATTSAPTRSRGVLVSTCFIEPCGQPPMGLSLTEPTFITLTRPATTTTCRTCGRWADSITSACTSPPIHPAGRPGQANTGQPSARRNGPYASRAQWSASNAAGRTGLLDSGPSSANLGAARSTDTVSSVKASGLVELVYDLTVADEHEFYAAGILVHNCTWQPTDPLSPGRIDASVYLAYGLLPIPAAGESSAAGAVALAQAGSLLPWGR